MPDFSSSSFFPLLRVAPSGLSCIPDTSNTVAYPISLLGLTDSVHHDNGLSAGPRPANETHQDPFMVSIPTVEYNQLIGTSLRYGSRLILPLVKLLSETQPQQQIYNLEPEHCIETSPERESTSLLENETNDYQDRLDEWVVSQPDSANEYTPRQSSFCSVVSAGSRAESYPTNSGRRAPREGNRTICLLNLAEGTKHSDVASIVRGGQVLDIYLRYRDNTASVSFLHEADAEAFFSHVRKHDLYIKNKRVFVTWSERQFNLSDHIVRKISRGATRNLVIRKCGLNHTMKSIRDDLEHIHNLVVLKVEFASGNCYIGTNSITAAAFARTCMMSRQKYKCSRIEYDIDECCQPLDQEPFRRPSRAKPPPAVKERRPSTTTNRFNLLDMNHDDDEA
ncbi:unnamed protein product [Clonostachys rosea]|uniref:RRM domain-containing protein n=1 Tax=Bionectria ochroleuca TaxID=29856 RepID=A0ABY6U653_BIOOC|nr:unnamed protein product [Clonostachys rosea]